jgi:hypothetical protein
MPPRAIQILDNNGCLLVEDLQLALGIFQHTRTINSFVSTGTALENPDATCMLPMDGFIKMSRPCCSFEALSAGEPIEKDGDESL